MMLAEITQALSEDWPAAIVHGQADARAACELAARAHGADGDTAPRRGLILQSAPGAGWYGGGGWFLAIAHSAAAAHPALPLAALVDCGALPGAVLDALRAGARAVIFVGPADAAAPLAAIAAARGARLLDRRPAAHDLATPEGRAGLAAATRADDKAGVGG